jgi:GNAT superfamily N-acetyltransferase
MLTKEDYVEVAKMHIEGIHKGFLSTLGVQFLTLMYRSIDEAETAVLIVEKENDVIVGFVSGGMGMGAIYKAMLRRFPTLFTALVPALVNPKKVWRIFEVIRHKSNTASNDLPEWELLSICVSPDMRGSGVAQNLYTALETDLKTRGATKFQIVVGEQLAPAHKFYKKMGATPHTEIAIHKGAKSVVYVQRLMP